MKLSELFKSEGRGVIATSNRQGEVNVAIYAAPHVVDDETLAWGMTEGRTYNNVMDNPNAAYLYMYAGSGYAGVRLSLKLKGIENSGEMLDTIKRRTREIVGPEAAAAVKHSAYFAVAEVRPLI
ncbi:MAG: pyridoxamine 5'-phosphate oxidase family protein [Dissulfurispiraceae bacterium]